MALDRVPWFVSTPGVQHSSEVARVLAHAATGGARGVSGSSGAMKVTPTPTASAAVNVAPGVAVAPSNYPGDVGQSYIMRNITTTSVAIAATGSSAGRSDAVVIRVDDVARVSQTPSDPNNYDYTKLQVIQGVSPTLEYAVDLNLAYPFVLLARIDLPKSTSVITASMIKDMRTLVLGREESVVRTYAQNVSDTKQLLSTRNAYPVGQYFPQIGGDVESRPMHSARVPEWATQMEIRAEWLSVNFAAFSRKGNFWVTYDYEWKNNPRWYTQAFKWASEDTTSRQNIVVMDTVPIPATLRGREALFGLRANRDADNTFGEVSMDNGSGLILSVRFLERAD